LIEEPLDVQHLSIVQFACLHPAHPRLSKCGFDIVEQAAILFGQEGLHSFADCLQLLRRGQADGVGPHVSLGLQ
jgi:hypothetical protein